MWEPLAALGGAGGVDVALPPLFARYLWYLCIFFLAVAMTIRACTEDEERGAGA